MSIFYLETTLGGLIRLDNFAKLIGWFTTHGKFIMVFFGPTKALGRFIALLQDL
jgi:hypothetical protein